MESYSWWLIRHLSDHASIDAVSSLVEYVTHMLVDSLTIDEKQFLLD